MSSKSSKKKPDNKSSRLELIFKVQSPDNGDGKLVVIGMDDTSVITLNFETFKSYLVSNFIEILRKASRPFTCS